MGDPGLLDELSHILALLPEGGGMGRLLRQFEHRRDWTPCLIFRESPGAAAALSAALLVGPMPRVSRNDHIPPNTILSFWQVRTCLAHDIRSPRPEQGT